MGDNNLKGNKGEWSEIYVFFKLLADGELYAADSELNRLSNIYYPIIKIIRDEISGKWEYYRNSHIRVVKADTKETIHEIPIKEFEKQTSFLLSFIKEKKEPAFAISHTEDFMRSIECIAIKANPLEKRDITIVVHDLRTGFTPTLGFSIKSQLGGPSTLLNASQSTNFIYKIEGVKLSEEDVKKINSIKSRSKIRDRIALLKEYGGKLNFKAIQNEIFELNLRLIDTALPLILSEIVFAYYSGEKSAIDNLLQFIIQKNPCNYKLEYSHPFYEYKIKNLLSDVALGLLPSKVWDGRYDATGGIIIVKEDGDVLCYHIYNRNEFQDYLIKSTKLDTPSTTKFKFGKIYTENSELLIKLNLQIRSIK